MHCKKKVYLVSRKLNDFHKFLTVTLRHEVLGNYSKIPLHFSKKYNYTERHTPTLFTNLANGINIQSLIFPLHYR